VFKRLETLASYLKDVGISRFDVDSANFDPNTVTTYHRPDASQSLKLAHAAAAHDRWFREQVAKGIQEANDPTTEWVSNETVKAESNRRRAAWRRRSLDQRYEKADT
jgi:hypothetical protein